MKRLEEVNEGIPKTLTVTKRVQSFGTSKTLVVLKYLHKKLCCALFICALMYVIEESSVYNAFHHFTSHAR